MKTISPNEYAYLVEQAPIMIWRARTDKLCDYFNERWLTFTGRTMEQEFGNGWAEGVHPDDFQRCVDFYVENFDRRQAFEMRYRLKRHDGVYRWFFDRGVPFFDRASGDFLGYIGSCIDITDQVCAELEIKELHEKKVQSLESLLPICSWCKKIRNDKGEWIPLENYLRDNSGKNITHGLCSSCKDKFFP